MSEFGLKIRNFQAGSVYEVSLGVREFYDFKDAMLSNSLFLDYMREHGLNIYKEKATRDIVGVEFNYGSSSYEEAIKKIKRKMNYTLSNIDKDRYDYEELERSYLDRIEGLKPLQDLFDKVSREELRTKFYEQGFKIKYADETIHYMMLYRTPGKAKKGTCMFIREELYDVARNYLHMGIELPDKNAPIVEIGAYSSLITSTVIGRVCIPPEAVLTVRDVDSFFNTNVISIETDAERRCEAIERQDYTLKNTMFDGQALIDESIFPEWGDGYVLLRQHFTKCAAFCTKIQKFFKEYYLDTYDTAVIQDMFGVYHNVKDIKLITTENAFKWTKFDVTFDYWADWVKENGSLWGIVKTAHESKFGEVQRMSYQMVNAMNPDDMEDIMKTSVDNLYSIKDDDNFIKYLKKNKNFSNDYEVLAALCEYDPEFIRCDYYRERKKAIIQTYIKDMKSGHITQNADNLVIVGSPYAMLLQSVGEDPLRDPTFDVEDDAIQCWTGRFQDGEYLAEFRSPFNSRNNLGHLHNHYHEYFDRYFRLGNLCIAINMNKTCFQDRNNGSDQDSDSIYTTNQPQIVEHARYCYLNYPTIVNNIPKEKNIYSNIPADFAKIDNGLAHSQLSIGESSNLAQICLSYTYNFEDRKYYEYVCILSVLAQAAIDSAKRRFNVDIESEIKRIKEDINIKVNKYPKFWLGIRKGFNADNINEDIQCPMNKLYEFKNKTYQPKYSNLPISAFLMGYEPDVDMKLAKKIANMISDFSFNIYKSEVFKEYDNEDDLLLIRDDFEEIVNYIKQIKFNHKYISIVSWILNNVFNYNDVEHKLDYYTYNKLKKNRSLLTKVLYTSNPQLFLQCFSKYLNTPECEKNPNKIYGAGRQNARKTHKN